MSKLQNFNSKLTGLTAESTYCDAGRKKRVRNDRPWHGVCGLNGCTLLYRCMQMEEVFLCGISGDDAGFRHFTLPPEATYVSRPALGFSFLNCYWKLEAILYRNLIAFAYSQFTLLWIFFKARLLTLKISMVNDRST
ncbi:uncharacterized protein H6S33_011422 [Morchella sextelata]|uniref:uncharacterized protein n=1 Tax=Morchella sextelata TaxID=1174677 RepID=UPI001D03CBEA|nr:uncharacterized protein H6S33_011422 [Morchella sextelata]KAH0610995.1 hypothetical protein H6S33_011422 [Morchella sextelata]